MIRRNLKHFRVFLAVVDLGTPTQAAARCNLSQPAVTQALRRIEDEAGGPLFTRTQNGFFLTDRGAVYEARIRRAMNRLDAALAEVAPRLVSAASMAQIRILIAMSEAKNFTLAARSLGLAQPTVHRAITQLEQVANRRLFERTPIGMAPTRQCIALARAARLAFAEFDQADSELADADGRDAGRIVIGSLPLSRSVVLPRTLARFRNLRPTQRITVVDGPYPEMLAGLRRGDIDAIVGALRDPVPVSDIVQERLFSDRVILVARPGHPLAQKGAVQVSDLADYGWVVPASGTPSRQQFDDLFERMGLPYPDSVIECGSILLMRELLQRSDLLGCISGHQAEAEIANKLIVKLKTSIAWPDRPIGLSYRRDWNPTRSQSLFLNILRDVAAAGEKPALTGSV